MENQLKNQNTIKKRNVGLQTVMTTNEYVIPSVAVTHNLEIDEYFKIVAIPHSITALVVLCGLIYYLSRLSTGTIEECLKNGIIGCILGVLVFGCLFLPDSVLRRPHPVLWRALTSVAILYFLIVTIILFQSQDNARQIMTFFDKNLGKPLPDRSYGENCAVLQSDYPYIKLDNFIDSIDFYLTAHLLGWYVKMLIIRNTKICWFLSILFEILEITFRHWLPNFWECWWDQAILDVFGMNALGIWLGSLTCQYFEMKNYKWISKIKVEEKEKITTSPMKKMFKFLIYFTPNYWVKQEWDIFSSTKRFYQVLYFFAFMNMVDLSHFFLKFILWLPQTHNLLAVRIFMWGLLAIISAREYYEFITNPSCKRVGHNVWIAHLILFVEWSFIIKFSDGMFTAPFPKYVIYFWTVVFMIISGITINLVVKDFNKYFKQGIKEKIVDLTEPEIEIEYVEESTQ